MSEHKIRLNLEVSNIGPHYGTNTLHFIADVDSNKAIFYAANGTGKSFISRAFRLMSTEKAGTNADDILTLGENNGLLDLTIAEPSVPGTEKRISISVQRNSPFIVQNDSGLIFHVFNSDFVEENVKPQDYTPDGNIDGYILGKGRIDLSEEKKREKQLKDEITATDEKIDQIVDMAKEYLRDRDVRPSTNEFYLIDKKKLRQNEVTDIVSPLTTIEQQLQSLKSLPEKIPDIVTPICTINPSIFDDISIVLLTSYPRSVWDEEFVSNIRTHRSLIDAGLSAYSDTDTVCPFCKQPLGHLALELIQKYRTFLAGKEASVLREIDSKTTLINGVVSNIKQFVQDSKNANAEIINLRQYFPSLKDLKLQVPDIDSNFFDCFTGLVDALKSKNANIQSTEFSVQEHVDSCKKRTKSIQDIQITNAKTVAETNRIKQSSSSERLILRRDLCKAKYLSLKDSKDLTDLFTAMDKMNETLGLLQNSIIEKEQQVRISKKEKVYDTLEYFLNRFFAEKYTIDKDTFQVNFWGNNIGNKVTKILSDGEKNIVAFCYYLASTHLQISRLDDYDKLFFIIDDPVSSMDFNFVYAVAQSLRDIKEYFGIRSHDRMWVFTHNLEFYSILARNYVIAQSFVLTPGQIVPLKHQSIMPYESHLKDILEIASGMQQPCHTSGNSIRYILETVCKFEYPEKALLNYILENAILRDNSCIFTLCQDLSHGNLRCQPPYSDAVIVTACKVVIDFMKSKYSGQVEALQPKNAINETT